MNATRARWLERRDWLRGHWRLLLEATFLCVWVELALRVLPFTRILARFEGRVCHLPSAPEQPQVINVARAIRWVYKLFPLPSTCLRICLVYYDMLTRRGLRAELRIGVMKTGGGIASHTWLENGHGTVLTDPLEGFAPFPSSLPLPRFIDAAA